MLRKKKIPNETRSVRTLSKAKHFILQAKIKWLPVDPFALYEANGWTLWKWSELREILGDEDPLRLKADEAEARTWVVRGSNEFRTVYDDTIQPFERIRWTLAHEIAHIILEHLTDYDLTAINRGGRLNNDQYEILEKEADSFAAELLAPTTVLSEMSCTDRESIKHVCYISNHAAAIKSKSFNRQYYIYSVDQKIKKQFRSYLKQLSICSNTSRSMLDSLSKKLEPWRSKMQKQYLVPTDSKGRFYNCPRCGFDHFSNEAKYCRMCGLFLYNNCANDLRLTFKQLCGQINPGDARYCECCGSETVLTRLGILKSWREIEEDVREITKTEFAASINGGSIINFNDEKQLDRLTEKVIDQGRRRMTAF